MSKPITSYWAFQGIGGFINDHQERIYELFLKNGAMNYDQIYIADDCMYFGDKNQIARRLKEMETMKLIQRLDWYEETNSGRLATMWYLKG